VRQALGRLAGPGRVFSVARPAPSDTPAAPVVDLPPAATAPAVKPTTASVSGVAFRDRKHNGRRDRGEPVLSGRLVFLDANRNRRRDAGERTTLTDARGAWSFGNLPTGKVAVLVEQRPGARVPAISQLVLDLKGGQAVTGRLLAV
jgi:hypothetical protein